MAMFLDETIDLNLSSHSGFNESLIVNTAPITATHPEGRTIAAPVVTRSGRVVKPVTRLDLILDGHVLDLLDLSMLYCNLW
jgi:hypothetical protein